MDEAGCISRSKGRSVIVCQKCTPFTMMKERRSDYQSDCKHQSTVFTQAGKCTRSADLGWTVIEQNPATGKAAPAVISDMVTPSFTLHLEIAKSSRRTEKSGVVTGLKLILHAAATGVG